MTSSEFWTVIGGLGTVIGLLITVVTLYLKFKKENSEKDYSITLFLREMSELLQAHEKNSNYLFNIIFSISRYFKCRFRLRR